jgi:hypothetical protein
MPHDLEWILSATGASSVTRGARVQSLWSGYGEIFRVHLAGWEAPTAIVKSVNPPPHERGRKPSVSHARKCRSYDVELAFYRGFAHGTDERCRVPRLIHAEAGKERWLFLLEDLDAAGYPERRRSLSYAEIERCLSWLANFHGRFLRTAPDPLWRTGTYWHLSTRRDELEAMDHGRLRAAAPVLDRMLRDASFQTLVHGDAKVTNFCFSPRGREVAAVDFQYVGGGVGMKDVAYLLSDHPSPHSETKENRFLDHYFAELRSVTSSADIDFAALEAEWRALYPIACADFYRFLAGWAKSHFDHDLQARRVTERVLSDLESGAFDR